MERIEEAEVLESQPSAYRRKLSLESPQRRLSPHPQPPYRGSSPSRPGRQRKYPKLYTGVCRQMGIAVVTEKIIAKNLSSMALHIFKKDFTWFKVASFYNLVSAAAVDCVRQGHPEYLYGIVEAAGLVIERDVANWIANQGGWVAILSKYRHPEDHGVFQVIALSVLGLIVVLVVVVIMLRSLANMLIYHDVGPPG